MSSTIKIPRTIFAVMFLLMAPSFAVANAQDDQALHAQAEELYNKSDFAAASQLYQRIADKTPSVYYNMANCAYKMDKLGYALLYWRRAERDWGLFGRKALLNNIDLVKQKVAAIQQKDLGQSWQYPKIILNFLTSAQQKFFSMIRAIALLYLQILVLALWAILFICLRCLGKRKHKALICLLFGMLALSASMLALKYSFKHQKRLVVIASNSPLLSGPGKNFAAKGQLPEAQEADILNESGDFYKIRVNKHTGWIDKQFVEKI